VLSQPRKRRGSANAVPDESRTALVAVNGPHRLHTEESVHRAGRGPAAGKHELEHGDVPSERTDTEKTASQPRAAVPAEGGASLTARDSVDDEAAPSLEGPDGARGFRPEETVDRACVQALRAKPYLQRADPGIALCPS
jgi:hypothetical protein